MAVEIRAVRQAVNTSTGVQDFDVPDWTSTPQLALYFITAATADNTPADHSIIGIGMAKSTSERATGGAIDVHDTADQNSARRTISDECIVVLDPADGNVEAEADFSEFHAGGSEVNWGNAPASAYLMTALYFAGFDNVDLQKFDVVDSESAQTVTVGFEADIVILVSTNGANSDTLHVNSELGMGVAVNGSGQGHIVGFGGNGRADGSPCRGISDSYIWGGSASDAWIYVYTIGNFTSTGFDLTATDLREIDDTDDLFVMALKLPTGVSAWVGGVASPTSGGDDPQASPSFKPQALLGLISNITAFDSWEEETAAAGSWAVTVATADDGEYCHAVANEAGSATTDTQSLVDDTLIHLTDDDGADQLIASLSTFDANGWTPNYSTVDGSALQQLWLAIEEDPVGSPSSSVSPSVSPSSSESPSVSPSVSPSSSASPSLSPSSSESPSVSPSSSESPSESPSLSPSSSESPSISPSSSESPSISPSSSESPSLSPSSSESPSLSPSSSASPSESPSLSPSSSESPSISPSSSESPSLSPSSSESPSESPSSSESPSISPSSSLSPSSSESPSLSPSSSESPSLSPSASVSPSSSESPSLSPSSSESPSESPSLSPSSSASPSESPIQGEVVWGHDTAVLEVNVRDFAGNWTGTGAIAGAGDAEVLELETGENMVSEVVYTDECTVTLLQNEYDETGDDVDMDYRHGATEAACEGAAWNDYTVPFASLGYVQIRMTSTL